MKKTTIKSRVQENKKVTKVEDCVLFVNKTKTIGKLENVKTPSNVKEFRENLGKCFWTKGGLGDELYVLCEGENARFIPIKDISSFDDIYKLTGTGFGGDGTSPSIAPKVSGLIYFTGSYDYFYLDQFDQMKSEYDTAKWFRLDSQVLRALWTEVLGSFSGYESEPSRMVA